METRIPLSQGKFAVVDPEIFDHINQWKWSYAHGYAKRNDKGRYVYLHRYILKAPPGVCVDHINGDTSDNRRSNLRLCSSRQNKMNRRKRSSRARSRFMGVHWSKAANKWVAQIRHNDRTHHLGCFESDLAAAQRWNEEALRLRGEFANLNRLEDVR